MYPDTRHPREQFIRENPQFKKLWHFLKPGGKYSVEIFRIGGRNPDKGGIIVDMKSYPEKWANDSLSKFLEDRHQNAYHIFQSRDNEFLLLKDINDIFEKVSSYLGQLQKLKEAYAVFMFSQARSSYLAAVRLLTGGQLPETYRVLRGCLENALHGFYFFCKPKSFEFWLSRHNDKRTKRKVRNEFQLGKLQRFLTEKEPSIGQIVETLYEITIDFGGHPNEKALTTNLKIDSENPDYKFQVSMVTDLPGNPCPYFHSFQTTSEIGIITLSVIRSVFKERFDITGVSTELDTIKTRYIAVFNPISSGPSD